MAGQKVRRKTKLRAGIIGCGRIAGGFAEDRKRKGIVTHVQAYQNNPGIELVAVADVDAAKRANFATRWGIIGTYADYNEMFAQEKLDMVSVCTPTAAHFDAVKRAILAGVKAVFCEKPAMATLAQADEIETLAAERKAVVAVNHSRRWDPFEKKIARWIASGGLGAIQWIDAYYTAGIANTGSHLIDLIRMLVPDEIVSLRTVSGLSETPDPTPDVLLDFKSGFRGMLHGLDAKKFNIFEIDIYGQKGRIRIEKSGFQGKFWRVRPHKIFSGYYELREEKHAFGPGYQKVLEHAVANVAGAIRGGRPVECGIREGKAVIEIILAAKESLAGGGTRIGLPLKNRNLSLV